MLRIDLQIAEPLMQLCIIVMYARGFPPCWPMGCEVYTSFRVQAHKTEEALSGSHLLLPAPPYLDIAPCAPPSSLTALPSSLGTPPYSLTAPSKVALLPFRNGNGNS